MAEVDTAPQFGAELRDGFKPVNAWVANGIAWLDEIQTFYRERNVIEREYSQKLNALAKRYHEKKAKRSSILSVGENPTTTPGSLESASMTTWGVQLSTLESRAAEHEKFANELLAGLAEPLKQLSGQLEDLRKHHADYAGKLEKERDGSYADLRKSKAKYDSVCQEVENKRKKQDGMFDMGKAKAATAFQQQQEDMRNAKNSYLITINVTNKQKERYYDAYIPEVVESLQDLAETRVTKLNSLWLRAAAMERQTLTQSTQLMEHLSSEIPRNQPHLDSLMFLRHNVAPWSAPADFSFEPSPIWLDDAAMAVDPASQVFLRNILTKSKTSLAELRREVEHNRKEVEGAKMVRAKIRAGQDGRDEATVLQSQFHTQEVLHDAERRKVTAEIEVMTISAAVGDISIGARAHSFKAQTFKIPTNCDLCGERIWGLSAKGFDCRDCGFTCHNKCEMKVPAECPGEVDKVQMKKLKADRQAAAQANNAAAAAGQPVGGPNGDGAHDDPRRSRRDTIGSMSTLSSGYGPQRSASGQGGDLNGASTENLAVPGGRPGGRRTRTIAPPPDQLSSNGPSLAPLAIAAPPSSGRHDPGKGKMAYAYQANGEGEINVEEGEGVVVVEGDDGQGWTKVRSLATSETGLVPTSYIDLPTPHAQANGNDGGAEAGEEEDDDDDGPPPSLPSRPGPSAAIAAPPSPDPSIASGRSGVTGKKQGPAVAPRRGGKKTLAPPPSMVSSGSPGGAGGPPAPPALPQQQQRSVQALYTYAASGEGEVDMREGERMVVVAPDSGDGWIEVERDGGARGIVPAGWVKDV